MAVHVAFHGAVREATGSNFLLETERAKILVDCGLHQGCHFCEGRNREPFPYDPVTLDAVVVTHAHVDHSGLLPKLVREGFAGRIFMTEPTRELLEVMLEDSASIVEEEARERNEEPPYQPADVAPTMEKIAPLQYRTPQAIAPDATLTLYDAGHILGSATAFVDADGTRVVFSGDLGNAPTPLLSPPDPPEAADYVLIESTYGDRIHEDREQRRTLLREAITQTIRRRGVLMVPSFALERTQEIIAEVNTLVESGEVPEVPVFIDSPLAIKATAIYQRHPAYYNEEAQRKIAEGDIPFRFPGLRFAETSAESKAINDVPKPKVIIAGSGMLEGGRILHHARRYLSDENSTLLIIGFQAAGSLGRRLLSKARSVRIFGDTVPVRAQVRAIGGYSAHADQEQLLAWLGAIRERPKRTFVVQGEEASSLALRQAIRERLGLDARVPLLHERATLM